MRAVGKVHRDTRTGRWWFVVDVPGVDGKRRQVKRRGFRTREDAQQALDDVRGVVRSGRSIGPKRTTYGTFLTDRWLPHLDADRRLKPTTKASYRAAVKHLVRHAGHHRLVDLDGGHLDTVQAAIAEQAPTMGHSVHVTARKSLTDAVRWRLIPHNPADDATPPPQRRPDPSAWSPSEVARFLAAAELDRWAALWRLAATTGMRRGELVGLRWQHVDLDLAELTVAENVTVVNGKVHRGSPKTDRSRSIRLDAATVAVLRSWRVQQVAELLVLGELRPSGDDVFTWADGSLVNPATITATFHRLSDRAGLPRMRLHSLRHAWATTALAAGVDVKDVSTRLGHSSVRVTYDIYVAPSSERDAAAADLVADLYRGAR
jgi:integrase